MTKTTNKIKPSVKCVGIVVSVCDGLWMVTHGSDKELLKELLHNNSQAWKVFPNGIDPDQGDTPFAMVMGVHSTNPAYNDQGKLNTLMESWIDPDTKKGEGSYEYYNLPIGTRTLVGIKLKDDLNISSVDTRNHGPKEYEILLSTYQ